LRIDEASGTLLFEGVRQRYHILGHAI
jgi:hypothetical protein